MPADTRFSERLKRIEEGRQIRPDGVVVPVAAPPPPTPRARAARAAGQAVTRTVMMLGLLLVGGTVISFYTQVDLAQSNLAPTNSEITVSTLRGGIPEV